MHEKVEIAAGRKASFARSPRLFENPLLDKLSRAHRLVPLFIYLPLCALLLWRAAGRLSPPVLTAGILTGYVAWTLVEYFGHRFLFHMRPRGAFGLRVHFLIHGVHHDHPGDPLRLVMPPLMSAPIIAAAFVVLRTLSGAELVLPLLTGFIAGYLGYDMLHFHVHHGSPRTRLGRLLQQRHMVHHFRDDTSSFGVSAPWWDRVFGTRPAGLPR